MSLAMFAFVACQNAPKEEVVEEAPVVEEVQAPVVEEVPADTAVPAPTN